MRKPWSDTNQYIVCGLNSSNVCSTAMPMLRLVRIQNFVASCIGSQDFYTLLSLHSLYLMVLRAKDGDSVVIYTSQAITSATAVSLQRGGMILIALLSGGDYDEVSSMIFGALKKSLTLTRLACRAAVPILLTDFRFMALGSYFWMPLMTFPFRSFQLS